MAPSSSVTPCLCASCGTTSVVLFTLLFGCFAGIICTRLVFPPEVTTYVVGGRVGVHATLYTRRKCALDFPPPHPTSTHNRNFFPSPPLLSLSQRVGYEFQMRRCLILTERTRQHSSAVFTSPQPTNRAPNHLVKKEGLPFTHLPPPPVLPSQLHPQTNPQESPPIITPSYTTPEYPGGSAAGIHAI